MAQAGTARRPQRMTLARRSGIEFPVSRVLRHMKERGTGRRISLASAIYLTAAMEYMTTELVELSGNACKASNLKRITPHHIMLAIRQDAELDPLLRNVIIPQAGILPQVVEYPTPRKSSKKAARAPSAPKRRPSKPKATPPAAIAASAPARRTPTPKPEPTPAPVFPTLPDAGVVKRIGDILSSTSNPDETVADFVFFEVDPRAPNCERRLNLSYELKASSLRRLKPTLWLNDVVVNSFMALIAHRSLSDTSLPHVGYISSHFDVEKDWNAQSALRKSCPFVGDFDLVLYPVNYQKSHWILVVVNKHEKSVKVYDSLFGASHNKQALVEGVRDFYIDQLQRHPPPEDAQFPTGWENKDSWQLVPHVAGLARQPNTSDCGVFACQFAEAISRRKHDLVLRAENMEENTSYWRQKIAYELVATKLLPVPFQ